MSVRERIAAWLAPEMAKDARRHWFLRQRLTEAAEWLGAEYPAIDATIHWAKVSTVVHFASLDDNLPEHVPGKPWIHQIHDFREHLRRTYPGGHA